MRFDTAQTLTPSFSYSHYAITFLNGNMAKAKATLQGQDFDTIIGTGLSGALVIPRLAKMLKVHWGIARKPEENSHRERTVEGTGLGERWVFVDDFIATGRTLDRVRDTVEDFCEDRGYKTEFVGSYEYKRDRFQNPDTDF